MKRLWIAAVFGVVALIGGQRTLAQPGPSFQGLGGLPDLPPPSPPFSVSNGISSNGLVAVGAAISPTLVVHTEAVRWTETMGIESLLDQSPGAAFAVSADGSVVVGRISIQDDEAFRWTTAEGLVRLGDLPGGSFASWANGVSADGSVIVGVGTTATGDEAFRWTQADGMVSLGALLEGSITSQANAVSADGTVVVGKFFAGIATEAFRWTATDGMKGLGELPGGGTFSKANSVSANNLVVVGASDGPSGREAFRWTESEEMVGLGMLPGSTRSEALAVSGDGSAIVGFSGDAAFIWDPINGMRDLKTVLETSIGLELTGIDLEKATGISDDGRVVAGIASHLNGGEAWIAVLNECGTDADCSDGLFCNGVETCVNNECIPGADACLPSDPCDEEQNLCLSSIPTVSHWGLIGMGLLLVSAATCVLRQRMGAVMPESRS